MRESLSWREIRSWALRIVVGDLFAWHEVAHCSDGVFEFLFENRGRRADNVGRLECCWNVCGWSSTVLVVSGRMVPLSSSRGFFINQVGDTEAEQSRNGVLWSWMDDLWFLSIFCMSMMRDARVFWLASYIHGLTWHEIYYSMHIRGCFQQWCLGFLREVEGGCCVVG